MLILYALHYVTVSKISIVSPTNGTHCIYLHRWSEMFRCSGDELTESLFESPGSSRFHLFQLLLFDDPTTNFDSSILRCQFQEKLLDQLSGLFTVLSEQNGRPLFRDDGKTRFSSSGNPKSYKSYKKLMSTQHFYTCTK